GSASLACASAGCSLLAKREGTLARTLALVGYNKSATIYHPAILAYPFQSLLQGVQLVAVFAREFGVVSYDFLRQHEGVQLSQRVAATDFGQQRLHQRLAARAVD